jgi:ElaB/YqjD/DUF883 family membrane-anchored ribosome-binding protein
VRGFAAGLFRAYHRRAKSTAGFCPKEDDMETVETNEQTGRTLANLKTRAQSIADDAYTRGIGAIQQARFRARSNPWISIAAASAGALALGLITGHLLKKHSADLNEEYPSGYDE